MSLAKEWRAFHANPTIDALTTELVKGRFPGCCCLDVMAVFRHHFKGDEIGYITRVRELGYRFSHVYMHDNMISRNNIIDIIQASGQRLDLQLYEFAVNAYRDNEKCGRLLLCLEDRGVDCGLRLPLFVTTFAICRVWARKGAILTLRVLREKLGKDVALMIARSVWEMRKFYISPAMTDENAMKRIKV